MLTKEKINKYKEKLEADREKLLNEIKTDKKMLDFGADTDHGDEEADETEERGNELGVESVLKQRINQIETALSNIKSGNYGKCVNCGGEISEKILDIAPESTLCGKCKSIK